MTIAQQLILELEDGHTWDPSYRQLLSKYQAVTTPHPLNEALILHLFPDGSAIVEHAEELWFDLAQPCGCPLVGHYGCGKAS